MATADRVLPVQQSAATPNWVTNLALLWKERAFLAKVVAGCFMLSVIVALLLPKSYESTARLMPPEQGNSGAAMLASLASRSLAGGNLGGVGSLAGSLLGGRTTSALYIDLLSSRTVAEHLIDRFNLQKIYGKRYRIDAVKRVGRNTKITEDKKTGVITITFTDEDRERGCAVAGAYVDELNSLLTRASTSSARREREFIERRLVIIQSDLQDAEKALSNFSSAHATLDIKEQTRAMVDAAAKLQAEIIVGQSELDSLSQTYGASNVRVLSTQARIARLKHELAKMGGSGAAVPDDYVASKTSGEDMYPPIRQLPRLAVPYADLYRRVRIQETVFELLSQQYEIARLEEARDTPAVSVIDPPRIAERKSSPRRVLIVAGFSGFSFLLASMWLLTQRAWTKVDACDPRKMLFEEIERSVHSRVRGLIKRAEASR